MTVLVTNHRPAIKSAVVCRLVAFPRIVDAEMVMGRVVGLSDCNTIIVLDVDQMQRKIRLAGIDAPEEKQPFGNRSKESLSELAFDNTVEVETAKRDRYRRRTGKVLVNGRDVNLVQFEPGMAWFYWQY